MLDPARNPVVVNKASGSARRRSMTRGASRVDPRAADRSATVSSPDCGVIDRRVPPGPTTSRGGGAIVDDDGGIRSSGGFTPDEWAIGTAERNQKFDESPDQTERCSDLDL